MMNRRQSIKRLVLGTLSAGLFFPSANEAKKHHGYSISPADSGQNLARIPYAERDWDYGRTPVARIQNGTRMIWPAHIDD